MGVSGQDLKLEPTTLRCEKRKVEASRRELVLEPREAKTGPDDETAACCDRGH